MAKQTSVIKLTGTIDGICYYVAEGVHLARRAYRHSKERMARDPAFERIRQNNTEFKGAVRMAKLFFMALAEPLAHIKRQSLSGRLSGLFARVKNLNPGAKGRRAFLVTACKSLLEGFEFNVFRTFADALQTKPIAFANDLRTRIEVSIPDFVPVNAVLAPGGATHFYITHLAFIISDYVFDSPTNDYLPVNDIYNGLSVSEHSAFFSVKGKDPASWHSVLNFPEEAVSSSHVSVVECMGIRFFKQSGADFTPLGLGNALKVVKVY